MTPSVNPPAPAPPGAPRLAVVGASDAGRRLAADLAAHLGADLPAGPPAAAVARVWEQVDGLVLVMATGAAVRLIAPHLADKATDPGVVAVDTAGRFAVPVAGGHEGGANTLAERLAAHLDGTAVVTTASEQAGLTALEALGRRFGIRAEGDLAAVGGALTSGGTVAINREVAWPLGPLPENIVDVGAAPAAAARLHVTDRMDDPGDVPTVWLRPPSLVVGVGTSRGVTAGEIGDLIDRTLHEAGLSPRSVAHVATVEAKADEEGLLQAAAARGWEVLTLPADRLAAIDVPNPSEVVAAAVGTPSVAEAAALHLGGRLIVEKRRSAMATVAVARRPIRGRVALVSLGPGDPELVTPQARAELRDAEVVVGYDPYVDQATAFVGRGCRLERYPLGDELHRAERAVALARTGRAVAVVSSGDVGIYAMASPTLEVAGDDVEVVVVPGVTAALAAGALLGAPLGHDHCLISLSDLLTPWELIRWRVRAAAEADLAVVFYNPRSHGRHWQLGAALRILAGQRGADTPVGVVRDAYRPGQRVTVTTLGDLDVEQVQMTTVVVVGNSRSRIRHGRIVTPRGYLDVGNAPDHAGMGAQR